MKDIFLKLMFNILKKLHELHNDLPFLRERMKIEKVEKSVANLHEKTEFVIHIWNLEQASNHRLVLKKVHRKINVNQNVWLKPYIDMNTDLRKKATNHFEKYFFKLMNNVVFGKLWKMWENIEILKKRKLFGVRTKLSYYKVFHRKLISNRHEKKRDTYEQTFLFRTFNIRMK